MSSDLYMSADEVCAALTINAATVYAYVSRGQIRSQRIPGSKKRRYWRADVDALSRGAKTPPSPPTLPTTLVDSSRITLLTATGHYYRGRSALEMARSETLESTAAWLWQANEREVFGSDPPPAPAESGAASGAGAAALQRAVAMLFAIEQSRPRAFDLSPEGYRRSGAEVLRCVAAACADLPSPSAMPIHLLLAERLGARAALADVLRHCLVLAADHELDPTTFAVRAAANTGVTPYAVVCAGLITSSGRRLIFGRSHSVIRLLDEIDDAPDPADPLIRRIREGAALPGFEVRPYPRDDPRAGSLLKSLDRALDGDRDLARLETAISTVREATGASPSFALPAMFLERKLGLGNEQASLLRLARVAGWIAHAMEQFYESELVRPHAKYVGVLPSPDEAP